ncbi:HNH endonuclease [Kurthia sibirica]|uniref:HNH endonuclease n=1 Tax=Kurthia sibirica TaxID=202750 RepID=A0A2U3AJL9_9BACL|nr:HNH endonuclease [Kurthia sibirica]PWI24738.1 HNH endonuclease [Kurthia sibirica]GEK34768.1 hypothetical protein KSI01_23010 [Kurthia sibirica]
MNHYIVMQGHTYEEEKAASLICTPQQDKGGLIPQSWLRMQNIVVGDRIFHYVRGEILAFSVAQSSCQQTTNTKNEALNYVALTYYELEKPLVIKDYFSEIQPLLPVKYAPFNKKGDGVAGYLFPCNDELALQLIECISELNIYKIKEEQLELAISTIITKEHKAIIPLITQSEASLKRSIRVGHEKYSAILSPIWHGECAICQINIPELLYASHSKPWRESTTEERFNAYNGILLCQNHAMLYKAGYIGFDGTGQIMISPRIAVSDYEKLTITPKMKIQRSEEHKSFFRWHRKHIFN